MLYLEDYLEMIEHLPQELRDRFTEMRELDLSVQNNIDTLEKRVKILFSDCKRTNDVTPNANAEFKAIREEYYKALEDADEKVQLANTMYELVDKYWRRLDTELHKFKCELEADNKGITELLEKRSLDLDTPIPATSLSSQKENRYERYRPRAEKRRDSNNSINTYAEKRQAVAATVPVAEPRHSIPNTNSNIVMPQPAINTTNNSQYNLSHIGAGPAIAAAASQAIAATQQMQQGRRTASLKASYEAINTGLNVHDLAIGRELAGAAQTAIQAIQQQDTNKKKQKKFSSASSSSMQQVVTAPPAPPPAAESPVVEIQSQEVGDGEWTYDPNEPRYCLCDQVSYGDMVACDNEDCPSEWFHYNCVGITAPPKGKWYCPQCTTTMRRRGGRKN